MNPIIQGLFITAIGMGLVFVAILFLWGLMAVLVQMTSEKTSNNKPVIQDDSDKVESMSLVQADSKRLQKVAAVAVAIAMGLNKQVPIIKPQESSSISPWQAAKRNHVFGQSAALLNRKSRGTSK